MSKEETTKQFVLNVEYEIGEEVYISPYWSSVHANYSGEYLTVKVEGYEYTTDRRGQDEPQLKYWTTYLTDYPFNGGQLFRTLEAAKDYNKKYEERQKTIKIEQEARKYLEAVKVIKEYEGKFEGNK